VFDISAYLDTLAAQAHPAGGWGYTAGMEAQQEPTCLALLALSLQPERFANQLRQGQDALQRWSTPDGASPVARGRQEALWPTAQVLFVQAALDYPAEEVQRTAARLLVLSGLVPQDPKAAEMHDIDFRLRGWAWAENTFSWAEPTAWACLALRRAGYGDHPRVTEGLKLLLDRAQDRGGINYGNRHIFGKLTDPIPTPTALMLLALQGRGDHPRLESAVEYLFRQSRAGDDLEHLCWAKLALSLYRDQSDTAALDALILSAHESRPKAGWTQTSTAREALTALALAAGQRNVFRLEGVVARPEPPSAPATKKKTTIGQKSVPPSATSRWRPPATCGRCPCARRSTSRP
jgi:hypothetical protein